MDMIESISGKNMVYTEEELDEMLAAAKPLIKWLNDNAGPYSTIRITCDSAELSQSYGRRVTEEFIKD